MIKSWKDDTRKFDSISEGTIKCACGHSILTHKQKILCNWCGNYAYKDKKLEFEEKLKRRINEKI